MKKLRMDSRLRENDNNNPLISVLMPMFNAAQYVEEAIQSIRRQTYPNWELIIIDDCSTDGSVAVVKKLKKEDPRIKLYRNPKNLGIGSTMNEALRHAKGSFLARMDADDVAFPERLEKQVSYLLNHHDVGIVGSYMVEINEHNDVIAARKVPLDHESISRSMINTQTIQNSTNMINPKLIPAHQLRYDGRYSPVDDLDFWFRQLNHVRFANIPEYLMGYRKHTNNSSLKNIKKTFALTHQIRLKALTKYGYTTGFTQIAIHALQALIVFTIPNRMLYGLFKLWKGDAVKKTHLNITDASIAARTPLHLKHIPAYQSETYMSSYVMRLMKKMKKTYVRMLRRMHIAVSRRAHKTQKAFFS
jgi:glycosyltransferase involved in cell wall biosynthesis